MERFQKLILVIFFRNNIKSYLQIYTNIFGKTHYSKVIDENLIMDDEK